ncbi:MAG: FGGY-family carbohydrate kinase [Geminicoccaceae bacterium]
MMAQFVTIDVGTGSIRAAVIDARGRMLALASRPHAQTTPQPGWTEQSPDQWWAGVVSCLNEIMAAPEVDRTALMAAAVCGQMHGPVPIGADGEVLLERVQLWNDKRATDQVARVRGREDLLELTQMAANQPSPSWIGFKLAWMRDHQRPAYERARTILTPKDFVNFRLTGEVATDRSEASGSFLMNHQNLFYAPELVDCLGLDMEKLPPIHHAASVIGQITSTVADETSLPMGLPVVVGGGDFLVAVLGAGVIEAGQGCEVAGTSNIVSRLGTRPIPAPTLNNLCAVDEGWVSFAILDAGGDALRWARRLMNGGEDWHEVDALAEAAGAGAGGVLFLPYLTGERVPGREAAKGQLVGLSSASGSGDIFRAVMEGVAFASRQDLELMRREGGDVSRLMVIGGGAAAPLWLQIKADIYRLPLTTTANAEGGLIGCAILAGQAAGTFSDAQEGVEAMVQVGQTFEPDPLLADRYDELFHAYRATYQAAGTVLGDLARARLNTTTS